MYPDGGYTSNAVSFDPWTVHAQGICMSVPVVHRLPEQSFEELRIEDYIKAYSTTGRPPPPCPPEPTEECERIALNLPPLFQPYANLSTSTGVTPFALGAVGAEKLPAAQAFHTVHLEGDIFQSISYMSGYTKFCHEELRYYAYRNGNILPPIPVPMNPFEFDPAVPPAFNPLNNPGSNDMTSTKDVLLTISATPDYMQHSVEELRVAYLHVGRELTSAEIFKSNGTTASKPISLSRSSLVSRPVRGSGFSHSPATPPH